jgi:hypothetical protein
MTVNDPIVTYAEIVARWRAGDGLIQAAVRAGVDPGEVLPVVHAVERRLDDDPCLAERFAALVANALATARDEEEERDETLSSALRRRHLAKPEAEDVGPEGMAGGVEPLPGRGDGLEDDLGG